jgi:transcriptional regulator with XRE-family HTH domain
VSDEVPLSYARAVGDRLRNLRRQRGLSLLAVEENSDREFKASVLGAYERGERIISVLRLQRLAQLYRVPVDQLLPRPLGTGGGDSASSDSPTAERSTERPPVSIDLVRLGEVEAPERDVIRRYVNMIQVQRGDFSGRSVTLRDEDLRALGRVFERDETGMRVRLQELGVRT